MCGIIQGFSKKGKRISKSVMKRYLNQKARGSNGFGYVAMYKDHISVGRALDEAGIRTQIMNEGSAMIMFHHRMPTSTANVIEATHPIFVSHEELDYDYYVVHNGVIRNCDELKKAHEAYATPYVYNTVIETETLTHYVAKKTGKRYLSSVTNVQKYNDSESLAIEVARLLDGMSNKIDAVGTIAFVAWKLDKTTSKLISISYGHNSGNPLTVTDNNDHFFLTSLGGTPLEEDVLFTLHTDGDDFGLITQKEMPIGYVNEWKKTEANKPKEEPKSRVFDYESPNAPFPKNGIRQEITPYKKNDKGVYEDSEDYYSRNYGGFPRLLQDWDRDSKTVNKQKMGFRTEDTSHIDTTVDDNQRDFQEISEMYVKEYLDLADARDSVERDLETANDMLKDKSIDYDSGVALTKEIESYEKQIDNLQGKMNNIEDSYYSDLGDSISFQELVDAYEEQELDIIEVDDDEHVGQSLIESPYVGV